MYLRPLPYILCNDGWINLIEAWIILTFIYIYIYFLNDNYNILKLDKNYL